MVNIRAFSIVFIYISSMNAGEIKISGSTTLLPASKDLVLNFKEKNTKFQTSFSSSGEGLQSLIKGEIDIARMSRPPSKSEIDYLIKTNKMIRPFQIGFDAVCVIVSKNIKEKLKEMNLKTLQKIFITGEISNWNQISKLDGKIHKIVSSSGSGTTSFLLNKLNANEFHNSVEHQKFTHSIVDQVSKSNFSIGIVSLALIANKNVDTLNLSLRNNEYVSCSLDNVSSGRYELSREVFFVVQYPPQKEVLSFLEYVLSPLGQKVIERNGIIPVNE